MSLGLINLLFDSFKSDPKSWIYSIIFGGVIYYFAKFYYKVKQYPKGPFPLPLIGTLYKFIGLKKNSFKGFIDLAKVYGPIYTFWLGTQPNVMIHDLEIAKEAFLDKKNEIAGRPDFKLFTEIFGEGKNDIALADYGPTWESLRRVTHAAVRKYAVDEKLALLVNDVVREIADTIKEQEGIDKPFDPVNYIYLTIYNILASSAFGKRYSINDSEFLQLKYLSEETNKNFTGIVVASDFIPILRPFAKGKVKLITDSFSGIINILKQKYLSHQKDYQFEQIRDFTDALIFAKLDALQNEKGSAPYLTDDNLALALSDLFSAGTDTTQFTLRWALLLMANYPEMQRRMRKEIEEQIGDRIPVQNDKQNCHYINAFISETLRHRIVVPLAVPHKTVCDVEIHGIKIPKDATVSLNTYDIMHNPNVFEDPERFKPERFLESNGKYVSSRPNGFIPFGMGRRVCLGEKLALADMFLVIVNLLQRTSGYEFALPDGPGTANLTPDPYMTLSCVPLSFNVMLKRVD